MRNCFPGGAPLGTLAGTAGGMVALAPARKDTTMLHPVGTGIAITSRHRPRPLLRTTLGEVLRRTRLEQGRTLADVARAAKVSMQYLSELERGRKEASPRSWPRSATPSRSSCPTCWPRSAGTWRARAGVLRLGLVPDRRCGAPRPRQRRPRPACWPPDQPVSSRFPASAALRLVMTSSARP